MLGNDVNQGGLLQRAAGTFAAAAAGTESKEEKDFREGKDAIQTKIDVAAADEAVKVAAVEALGKEADAKQVELTAASQETTGGTVASRAQNCKKLGKEHVELQRKGQAAFQEVETARAALSSALKEMDAHKNGSHAPSARPTTPRSP